MKNITHKTIVEVYMKKGCNVSVNCRALGITRTTFYKWRDDRPRLHQMLVDAEEAVIDNAESKLLSKINDGDVTSLIFFLKTKGKKRGYIETARNETISQVAVVDEKTITDQMTDEEASRIYLEQVQSK